MHPREPRPESLEEDVRQLKQLQGVDRANQQQVDQFGDSWQGHVAETSPGAGGVRLGGLVLLQGLRSEGARK